MIKRNILLNPGPATTTDSVKRAQVVPDICPREREFSGIMAQIRKDLVTIVKGTKEYTSIIFAGSGTAAMDACINSVVAPNKKIAIINNGLYGERMVEIAHAYKIPYVRIDFEWDQIPDLDKIKKVLTSDPDIGYVAAVHHETTTGILNPIKEIGAIAKENNCVFIVDTISSFAGIPIDIKDARIDFMFSTSNKCIQGMAGMCFVICSRDELTKTRDYPRRAYYLNLWRQYEFFERTGEMQFTPPVQVTYALRQAIREYYKEGGQNRSKRYTKNWRTLRDGLIEMGFELLLREEDESHILTTIIEPQDPRFNFTTMHDLLYKKGFTIYPGKIGKKKTFRLANMGAIDHRDIKRFLSALRAVLRVMKVELP